MQSDVVADRPVVILALDWICEWPPLRMALNAGVVRADVIHVLRVQHVRPRWVCHVLASRAVTAFASHIPLRDLLLVSVEPDEMAAVTGRTGRALHIIGRIKMLPPVCARFDEVRE